MGKVVWLEAAKGCGKEEMAKDAKGDSGSDQGRFLISPEVRMLLIAVRRAILMFASALDRFLKEVA